MNTIKTKEFTVKPAQVISVFFHPLLIPVYGMAIIFSAPTLFGYLPFTVKKLLFFIVLVNNVLVPISLLPFLRYRNIISSWTIFKREERTVPLIISTLLYSTTSYIIYRFPLPVFLKSFIFAAAFVSLIVTLINFRWKISLHSVGAGYLLALVLLLSFKMYTPLLWYLISAVFAGGLVMSSSLRLNFHNPQQVWFGFLTGFFGLTLFMMFF
jgi:hypothetical protein